MRMLKDYDWETREDAETLVRCNEIKKDPKRLQKAQSCIKDTLQNFKQSLGKTSPNLPSRSNPATISRFDCGGKIIK